eukprot:UN32189
MWNVKTPSFQHDFYDQSFFASEQLSFEYLLHTFFVVFYCMKILINFLHHKNKRFHCVVPFFVNLLHLSPINTQHSSSVQGQP